MSDYYTESQINRIEHDAHNGAMLEAGKEWERQRNEFNSREHELESRIAELESKITKAADELYLIYCREHDRSEKTQREIGELKNSMRGLVNNEPA